MDKRKMIHVVSEPEFRHQLIEALSKLTSKFKSVSGPGRSGAVAAVYASHYLKIPFIPHARNIPDSLRPHLVIDTAFLTGMTLRKAHRKALAQYSLCIYHQPPRVKFWYEFL